MVENSGLCRIYSPAVSIDSLQLRNRQKEELRNSTNAWQQLFKAGLGFNMLISAADISTAIQSAEAIANDSGLKIRAFDFEAATSFSEDKKIYDTVLQKKVSPLHYAFANNTGDAALLLFIDYSGKMDRLLNKDKALEEILLADLTMYLRTYKGFFCLVTKELQQKTLPLEFNLHYQLDYPPESLQIARWEKVVGAGSASDDELVRLVEEYPMHISEIDFIGRQSSIRSIIQGGGLKPSLDCIQTIIGSYRRKNRVPLLFGRG